MVRRLFVLGMVLLATTVAVAQFGQPGNVGGVASESGFIVEAPVLSIDVFTLDDGGVDTLRVLAEISSDKITTIGVEWRRSYDGVRTITWSYSYVDSVIVIIETNLVPTGDDTLFIKVTGHDDTGNWAEPVWAVEQLGGS